MQDYDSTASSPTPPAQALGARLRRLRPYFGNQRLEWVVALLTTVVAAATEPLIPALLKPLLDEGFTEGSLPLWLVPVAIIGVFLIRGVAQFTGKYALARIANEGMVRLRAALFDRLLAARMDIFDRQSASTLSNTVVYEVQNGFTVLVQAVLGASRDGFTVLALLGYLLYLNWQLTLIVALMVPTVAWVMTTLSKRLYRITRASQGATDDLAYVVEENVLAHRVVRLHGAQAQEASRFEQLSERLRQLAMKSTVASGAMTPAIQLLAAAALSTVICIALWQGRGNGAQAVSVGGFAAFIAAMLMLISPIKRLADIANPITRGVAALERGQGLLDETQPEDEGSHQSGRAHGAIELRDVRVCYAGKQSFALDGITLAIKPGEVVALVGPSGAGKSTLFQLLLRFYDPAAGSLLFDGVDIRRLDPRDLRSRIALVPQEPVIFGASAWENIRYGLESASDTDVRRAAEAAHALEFIERLPQGFDTHLGERGVRLSGGERQRIAIARTLLRDPALLLLDEATSALDAESERLVQEALETLMHGRTSIVIAHRLATVRNADRILVIDQGRIVASGRHDELMAQGELYARLAALQFQEPCG